MATSTDRVTADSKPTIKKLQRHVIPHVVTKWNELGFELFDEEHVHMLDAIYTNHSKDVNKCCHEMFRKWLATYDNTTWHQIVEALKSPGIELGLVAAELEKNLIGKDNGSSDHETLDFTKFKDVSLAYTTLFSTLLREVKIKGDFVVIQTACEDRADQKLRKQIKKTRDISSLFKLLAGNESHCNWLNVRFLEVIAIASGNSKLTNLIQEYEEAIYSKTLGEVWSYIPYHKVRTKYYSKLQVKFDGKNPDDVTVEEFKGMCEPYLLKKIVKLIAVIKENSIRITWLIPTDTVYEYYLSALIMPQELRLDSYLQIGDWVVHHPLHVLQVLQKDYRWILPSTLLIGYYHSLLMRDIDPYVVMDKMCSNGLLTPHDQGTILAGYSIYQRSWLLLEHVRHMEIKTLVKFCEFVQEVLPQVGVQLVAALNFDTTMEPEYYAPSLVFKSAPTVYSSPSSLLILFLGLMDQVYELLQLCDAELLMETCRNLMASEPHRINLFSDSCINNLSDYTSAASLLRCLSFLFTWNDHSILRALVSCSHEAIELLDKFDSFLDPFNTVISYPINAFSLSMIPFKDSPYTILAIRCNRELWQCSLQYVLNIRSILVELCEITQHCLQLLATQSDPTIFYWNIPKCVVKLVEESLEKHDEYLCSQGIIEVTVYPKQLLFIGDDVIVGSLAFVVKQEINAEDVKKTSTEALLKAGNKKIDYLQSELNKSKQLGEQFQKAAEKATEKYENLLKEYNRLKESSEKDTMTKLENLNDKISNCNLKLEQNLEQIFPDCQPDTEPYQEKDPMQQVIYNVEHLQKLVKRSDDIWSEYDKQKQEKLQLQDELQSELKVKTELIEENEKLKKLKESSEEDTMTKLENLKDKISDCNLKLEKNLKQIFPDCQFDMEPYQEKDPMQQVIYDVEHLQKLVKHSDDIQSEYDKQKQEKLQIQDELHSLESELKAKRELIEENEKLKKLKESSEEDTMTKLENLKDKISDCNLKLEKKMKQIFPDCQLDMEAYQEKDPMEQVIYHIEHLEKLVKDFDNIQSEYDKQKQEKLQLQDELQSELKVKTRLIEENEKLKKLKEETMTKLEKLKDQISDRNVKLEKKLKQIFPDCQLDMEAYQEKDPIQQVVYNLDHLEKSVNQFQSEYSKQQQIQLQQSQDLHNLKSVIELRSKEANKNISYLQNELDEIKHMIEQFQEAAMKSKESNLDRLQRLVKHFDVIQSEYDKQKQKELQLRDELDSLELKTTKLKEDNKMLLKQLRESKQLGEQFQEAAEKATEKYENLLKEYNRTKESSEKDTMTKLENLKDKVSDCNLKLEKILKQILPDYQLDMETYQEKDPIQQVIYNVEHLQELVKHFNNIQFEYDKQKQKELQLQEELHNLESELTVKTTKLKEDNKMLLKKLRESKTTNIVPATSRPDNVDYPVKYGQLGSGLFGEVHRVYYKSNPCAGKIIHKEVLSGYRKTTHTSMSELQIQLEIKCKSLAGNLYHPNVEQFFEVVLSSADDGVPMILTELLTESLTVFVERCKETIHVNQEIDLCNNMAQGLACLHSSSLVHGNLHGNNVLISRDGRAKIADYLCPLLFSNVDMYNSSGYLAPEVFQNKTTPSTQSNVFTLGVLFLQVITKCPPQPRTKDSSYSERENDFAEVSSHHPLVPLIQQCLQNKEINRPLTTHVCDKLIPLIKQNDSPQRMAYKLLYTAEHKPLAAALTSGKQQQLQHLLCENMPAPMFWGYAVVNNETEVYVTGGNSHSGMAIENVYRFSILLNQWDKLPSTGLHHSVPIILKNELTLIGGRIPGNKIVVGTVVTYDDGWKSKYPDMIQPRYRPAVVTYGDHVIVLGGRIKDRSTATDSIEVMNVEERRWIKLATRLPSKIYDIQVTVSRDCVWIVGYDDGYKRSNKVLSIPVKDLISDPTLKHSFKTIRHDTLYYKMSLVPNSDPLVVLGGDNWRNKPTSAVIVFDYKTESWSEVASLSSPRAYCAVATVGQRGLLVIGGCSETKSEKASNSTCLQTVELYYI